MINRVNGELQTEFAFEILDEELRGCEDLRCGCLDEFGVAARPAGDVGNRVHLGVEADCLGKQVRNRLSLDFEDLAWYLAPLFVSEAYVCPFVLQRLDLLWGVEVVSNQHLALGVVRQSVPLLDRSACVLLDHELVSFELVADRRPDVLPTVVAGE